MREATDRTTTANLLFRAYAAPTCGSTTCAYADGGIVDADTTAPTAPATLSAVDHPGDTGGSIDLSWAAATDNVGVTGYKLYRGTAAGVYGAPTALGNVTTYTDATAVTGTRYYYAVSAVDAAGNEGAKSPESSAIAVDNTHRSRPPASTAPSSPAPTARPCTPAWTLSGTPQRAEYDTARAKNGTLSGWIQGPTTAAAAGASATRRHDLRRRRVPLLDLRRHRQPRTATSPTPARSSSCAPTPPARCSSTPSAPPTGYTANAYTAVGTYAVGWTEYRVVLDFTSRHLHAVQARERHRRLDAAEGGRRRHLRHPHA